MHWFGMKKNIYFKKPQQWVGKYFILFKSEIQCEKNESPHH